MDKREYSTKNIDRILLASKNSFSDEQDKQSNSVISTRQRLPKSVNEVRPKKVRIRYGRNGEPYIVVNGRRQYLSNISRCGTPWQRPVNIGNTDMDGILYDYPHAYGIVIEHDGVEDYAKIYPYDGSVDDVEDEDTDEF